MNKRDSVAQSSGQDQKFSYATESDADNYTFAYLKKKQNEEEEEENSELDFFTEDELDSQYSGQSLN